MKKEIEEFFSSKNIEYYAAIDYKNLREINPSIILRSGFSPESVIVFLLPYYAGECKNLSIYSAAKDYHIFIKYITTAITNCLMKLYPDNKFCGFGDHSPIDERHAALSGGLGVLGDNGLLINEKYGTYIFIAEIITDILPEELGCSEPKEIKRCKGCGSCFRACPTGILRGEGSYCLSAVTQRKGELSKEEISLMKKYNTVWGCDICQTACPYNKMPKTTPIEFFKEGRITNLTTEILDKMTDEEFKERAFAWRGRKTIARNLKYFD